MSSFPDTRASLIVKIADAQNAQAWEEFARLYQPVVYRLARGRGFQDADAEELVQEVMLAVARAVERWDPEAGRGRFRFWLHRIARNLMINYLTRRKYQVWGTGKTDAQQMLEAESPADPAVTQMFELEYRREAFRVAARQVQATVSEQTWQAFSLTTIDDLPVREVARQLGLSVGTVYIARSRVMARLRRLVKIDEESES